jgi:transcription antitermination protein NusB
MGTRRAGRERALQALFQIDLAGVEPETALDYAWKTGDGDTADPESVQFARELVLGVAQHRDEIDKEIETSSLHWRLERMARVDRNILRLAVFELRHREDVPKRVAMNEAIELAKTFGSEDSSAFVNGILDKIAQGITRD